MAAAAIPSLLVQVRGLGLALARGLGLDIIRLPGLGLMRGEGLAIIPLPVPGDGLVRGAGLDIVLPGLGLVRGDGLIRGDGLAPVVEAVPTPDVEPDMAPVVPVIPGSGLGLAVGVPLRRRGDFFAAEAGVSA